jgi:hypothetical protein
MPPAGNSSWPSARLFLYLPPLRLPPADKPTLRQVNFGEKLRRAGRTATRKTLGARRTECARKTVDMRTLRRLYLMLVGIIVSSTSIGQVANYVINPSFEDVQTLPWHPFGHWVTGWSAIDTTKGAFLPCSIGPPFNNSPGASGNHQFPRTGSKMILFTYYCHHTTCADSGRGYPRNRLKTNLKQGVTYCVKYFVNIRDASPFGISDFSALAADSGIDTIKYCRIPLPYLTPQVTYSGTPIVDTLNWTAVNGTFVAQGLEKYLVLGNFAFNLATHTVAIQTSSVGANFTDAYFDDVSLVEMELPAFAGKDTNIVPGDSIYIGRQRDVGIDYACQWFQLPNDSVPIDTSAGIWVKPTSKTSYIVRQQLWCSGVKWDTVTVHFNVVGLNDLSVSGLEILPNPNKGEVTIKSTSDIKSFRLTISDVSGKILFENSYNDQLVKLDLPLPSGLYFVEFTTTTGTTARKIIIQK